MHLLLPCLYKSMYMQKGYIARNAQKGTRFRCTEIRPIPIGDINSFTTKGINPFDPAAFSISRQFVRKISVPSLGR